MIGSTVVVSKIDPREITTWRKQDIEQVVTRAFAPPSQTSVDDHFVFQTLFEGQLNPVMKITACFLGDNPDTSGGTMGAYRRPPAWMFLFMEGLSRSFMIATLLAFDPPYNQRETTLRVFKEYLWHMVKFHD